MDTNWICPCGNPQSYPIPHEHDRTDREHEIIAHFRAKIKELELVQTKSLIKTRSLTTLEDFKSLKKWDYVACTFHRDIPFYKTRFRVFEIYENKERCDEIILERRNNIYFNYKMFLSWESYLKDILLISE